jgi:hypothetical protein
MRRLRSLVAIVLLVLASACGRYFPPDIHLPRYATAEEIVGTWNLAEHTLRIAKRDGYVPSESTPHQIVFRTDGTCDFQSITEFGHKAEYRDSRGSWKLEHDTGMPREKKKKNEVVIRIKDRGISLYLTEEKGRLVLWDFWGDPDEWELLRYEKRG